MGPLGLDFFPVGREIFSSGTRIFFQWDADLFPVEKELPRSGAADLGLGRGGFRAIK